MTDLNHMSSVIIVWNAEQDIKKKLVELPCPKHMAKGDLYEVNPEWATLKKALFDPSDFEGLADYIVKDGDIFMFLGLYETWETHYDPFGENPGKEIKANHKIMRYYLPRLEKVLEDDLPFNSHHASFPAWLKRRKGRSRQ